MQGETSGGLVKTGKFGAGANSGPSSLNNSLNNNSGNKNRRVKTTNAAT